MIVQHVHVFEYDWHVDICYDARPKDAQTILDRLWDMGCAERYLHKAERLLTSGVPNEGLTYSDKKNHCTLIVVGHATDLFSAFNTIEHECNHLETSICEYYGIDMHGEEASYLSGDIKEAIARNAWMTMRKLFLCLL